MLIEGHVQQLAAAQPIELDVQVHQCRQAGRLDGEGQQAMAVGRVQVGHGVRSFR